MTAAQFSQKHPFFTVAMVNPQYPGEAMVLDENREKIRRWLDLESVKRAIPNDIQFVWSAKPRTVDAGQEISTRCIPSSAPPN